MPLKIQQEMHDQPFTRIDGIKLIKRKIKYNLKFVLYLLQTGSIKKIRKALRIYRNPVVIGGCGRSGTTLLLSLMSCHPSLFCIGRETGALCPPHGMYPLDWPVALKKHEIIKEIIDHALDRPVTRWVEKTPRNVLVYKQLLKHYGRRLKIVTIVRDGRDVCTSRHPLYGTEYYVSPQRWVHNVKAGLPYENHPQAITIRYEDLISNFEGTMREVFISIGEEFSERILNYPETAQLEGEIEKNAWFTGRKGVNAQSVQRWKKPESAERLGQFMDTVGAKELLCHYQYKIFEGES